MYPSDPFATVPEVEDFDFPFPPAKSHLKLKFKFPPALRPALHQVQKYTSSWIYLCRPTRPPSTPYTIALHPQIFSKKYYLYHQVRQRKSFRLRDSPLASLFRMYEMLLCGLNDQLACEAEYFWRRKWRISTIPDPATCTGWERDLDRDRICQVIVLVLIEAWNYYRDTERSKRRREEIPKWAQPGSWIPFDELVDRFPGLEKVYFFLPWKKFAMVDTPCTPDHLYRRSKVFIRNFYQHMSKMHSILYFHQQDSLLSSLCRLYELRVLAAVDLEMGDFCEMEWRYFLMRWGGKKVEEFPDPRGRWQNMERTDPEVWSELQGLVAELGMMEISDGRGSGMLPSWVRMVEEVRGEDMTDEEERMGSPPLSDGGASETTLVN